MKGSLYRVVMLAVVALGLLSTTDGRQAEAMKALSCEEMGGVTGMSGISLFFKDIDATLLEIESFKIDLSPSDTNDSTFLIADDNFSKKLYSSYDTDDVAMSFCGVDSTGQWDENEPIDVDYLGLEIDIGSTASAYHGLAAGAVTLSMVGYGSTNMHWVWDLAQFLTPTNTYDVFGLHLGEIFWAEEYIAPASEKNLFMHLLLSPLSAFADSAFVDSSGTGAQVRSNIGLGGELGLKPGGGSFGFLGFDQEATANAVMLAGKIIDRGTATTPYPNWRSYEQANYYKDTVSDWNIMGEAVMGVHHQRTYTRSGYTGKTNTGGDLPLDWFAQRQIGYTSAARPIRFEVATSTTDCDDDGSKDTYLVAYVNGHYSRTVYYPDSAVSSMGRTPTTNAIPLGGTPAAGLKKEYIIGDLRIGNLREADPDRDGDDLNDITTETVDHSGSWVLNDLSVEYTKIVIPGDRTLVEEIQASSENYLIPNRDFNNNYLAFSDDNDIYNRTMRISTPFNGYAGNPQSDFGTDLTRPGGTWWQ